MKGKMDYKTKRNIVIVAIVIALFLIASISTYVYLRGNTETKAVSEINSMSENSNASQEQTGEVAQNNEEQTTSEEATTEESTETETVTDETSEEPTSTEAVSDDAIATRTEVASTTQNSTTSREETTEPETTVEETTNTGFTSDDANIGNVDVSANLPTDTTAPVYKTLGIWNDTHYNSGEDVTVATTNDSIRLRIDFEEKLATEPKVKVIGADGTETILDCTFRPLSSSDTNFVYMTDFKITEEMNLPEGEVQFEIYEYADAAGNEGTTLTNKDINWDRFPKVVYDITAPEYKKLGITNITHYYEEGSDITVAGTGDQIRILVLFDEKLATEPKADILDSEGNVLKTIDCAFSQPTTDSTKLYSYLGNFNITEDMNLPEGEIQFVVYGYADEAGNEGARLDNSKLNYDPYLKVVYDKTAPEVTFLEITSTSQLNNQYAKVGDEVWVKVGVNEASEELSQYPIIKINGQTVETFINEENEAGTLFAGKLVMTEEMEEGVVTFEVSGYTDKAGNVGETLTTTTNNTSVTFDKTAPVYSSMGIFNWTNDNYGGDVTYATANEHIRLFVAFPEMLAVDPKVDIYGEDGTVTTMDLKYGEDAKFYFVEFDTTDDLKLPQGKIEYKIYGYADAAGNVGKELTDNDTTDSRYPQVVYDSVKPVYTNLGIARNKDEDDTRDQHYAKEGDSVRILISFDEELETVPTVKFDGKEYEASYRPLSSDPENNLYYYMADITMTADMPEGEMQFEVYGYADAAGNEGELLNNNKITDKTYDKVIYDMTAPYSGVEDGSHPLYILNVSDASRRQWIRNGEMLRVEANFNEDLDMSKTPVLTIGTESNTQTAEFEYKDTVDGKRSYVADIVIDNSILNLAEGTQVPFTVTNAFDKAGNEAVLDNDDVTYTNEYGQVTYDSEAPKYSAMGIVNATHYDSKEGDIHYAKTDDEVRILVQFDEKLSVEPRIRILGANNEVVKDLNCGWASQTSANLNTNAYTGQFKITDDMNLPEGEIRFEVYGYKDAAGNEGEVLDNEDLDYPGEPSIDDGVIYDNENPAVTNLRMLGGTVVDGTLNGKPEKVRKATNGDTIKVYVSFNEEVVTMPTLTINDKIEVVFEGPNTYPSGEEYYIARYTIADDDALKDGPISVKITGYKDVAGNEGKELTNADMTVAGQREIIIDKSAPTVTSLRMLGESLADEKINGNNVWKVTNGDIIRVYAQFDEELVTMPTLTINNKVEVVFEGPKTYQTSGEEFYYAEYKVDENDDLEDGLISVSVKGYKDAAGNEGTELTNANMTVPGQSQIMIAKTTSTEETGDEGQSESTETTTSETSLEGRISTETTDNGEAKVTLTTTKPVEAPEGWNQEDKEGTTFTTTVSEGEHSVDVSDEEGNEATVKFSVEADTDADVEETTNTENVVEEAE